MEEETRNPQGEFDAKEYLRTRFGEQIDEKRSCVPFCLRSFHDFYTKLHETWDSKKTRLLEFGGGPTIYSLISAALYVKDITFAEFEDANREEVRKWIDRDPDSHNWFPYVSLTVNRLENLAGEEAVREREELIRSKVSSPIPCNVFDNPPVDFSAKSFDIIHCCNVIESACKKKAEFEDCIRQLSQLLRPGGHIVLIVQIERKQYTVGNTVFSVVFLTLEDVHESTKNAGFAIISTDLYLIPKEALDVYSGMKAFAMVVAQRTDS